MHYLVDIHSHMQPLSVESYEIHGLNLAVSYSNNQQYYYQAKEKKHKYMT